jgi:hypothetical protein
VSSSTPQQSAATTKSGHSPITRPGSRSSTRSGRRTAYMSTPRSLKVCAALPPSQTSFTPHSRRCPVSRSRPPALWRYSMTGAGIDGRRRKGRARRVQRQTGSRLRCRGDRRSPSTDGRRRGRRQVRRFTRLSRCPHNDRQQARHRSARRERPLPPPPGPVGTGGDADGRFCSLERLASFQGDYFDQRRDFGTPSDNYRKRPARS